MYVHAALFLLSLRGQIHRCQSYLHIKQIDSSAAIAAIILVPTRELADQVFKAIELFSSFCAKDVRAVKLTDKLSDAVQRSLLSTSPDIVISTPARAWSNAKSNQSAFPLERLSHLVLDEADLLLSYGYEEDLENLSWSIPKGIQTIMMSATLTTEIESLKKIFYRDNAPTLLDLEEPDAEGEGVTQLFTKSVYRSYRAAMILLTSCQVRRGRKVLAGLYHFQIATGQGQMSHLCQR